jgi:hypothetical protein
MSEKAKLRKYEDDLNVSGAGVIIMGIWSIVRILIEIFLDKKALVELQADEHVSDTMAIVLSLLIIALIAFIVMKIHLYIGLNAMRAAKGKEHKGGYFIAAIIFLILSVASLASYKEDLQGEDPIDVVITSMLVDLTTIYVLAVVAIATLKIKKLREKEPQG